MDTTKPSIFSTSPNSSLTMTPPDLAAQQASEKPLLLLDVRKHAAYAASAYTLPGAQWHDPLSVADWAQALPATRPVCVYCVHGHEVSQNTQRALRELGVDAVYLEGGFEAWRVLNLPLASKPVTGAV